MAPERGRCPDSDSFQDPALGGMAASGHLALGTLPRSSWVRGSGPAVLSRLRDAALVRPGFLSTAEEETLSRELEPELRRRRYEYDHWDAVRPAAPGGGPRGGATAEAGPVTLEVKTGVERWVAGGYGWERGWRHGAELDAEVFCWPGKHFGDEGRAVTGGQTWNCGVFGGQDQG